MPTELLALYEQMFLVRQVELAIQSHYPEDEMKTPMHMSMGEEAIVAGVCAALGTEAQVLGTYRSHALYLIKTGDLHGFMAEMYGKATGSVGGRGGSMHLLCPERGLIATSAIVASCIPVAAGAAFANQYRGTNRVVAVFFGDGAIDEGVFWETINLACSMKLPLLFVCEDNGLAVHIPAHERHGYRDIATVVRGFDCHVAAADTVDPLAIRDLTRETLAQMRATGRPGFLHLRYFRFLEHVGVCEDFKAGYRLRPDAETMRQHDPVTVCRDRLLLAGQAAAVTAIETHLVARVEAVFATARAASFPPSATLQEHVYA